MKCCAGVVVLLGGRRKSSGTGYGKGEGGKKTIVEKRIAGGWERGKITSTLWSPNGNPIGDYGPCGPLDFDEACLGWFGGKSGGRGLLTPFDPMPHFEGRSCHFKKRQVLHSRTLLAFVGSAPMTSVNSYDALSLVQCLVTQTGSSPQLAAMPASIMQGPNGMQPPVNAIKLENPSYYCNSYTPPAPEHTPMMASGAYSKNMSFFTHIEYAGNARA
uniref:Uncharacterized protein n=1 Tax=Timema cristinae TaxID=61476 RepID=A0A7R9CBA8_TIMCR|nr:unnamed protein product [Timema cristinae]